ncbi:ribosome biogenesis GTPase Der [Myxococcota bacterium]|nr:ribosome biogenesis GTPase Der [Myxococcota bacterium]MBU1380677.1 ribosome biogenesis GTPase Der [Myxococcota bacterium]MBU1495885.1 ribosome biogenesis GTPase Der [Myxococcota bacterium]
MALPIIAIVGRPNVGKSTLFNRIIKQRRAITEDIPGVTRDRIYGEAHWGIRRFRIIDTGGLDSASEESMKKSIASQVKVAIDEADAVLFIGDGRDGLMPEDRNIIEYLRKINKPFVVAANKLDSERADVKSVEFFEAGVEKVFAISATHDRGVSEVLDELMTLIPETEDEPLQRREDAPVRITFLGRPNAGKSSIINNILGSSRMLVDDVAGTTIDSVEVPFVYDGNEFVLVDTAGMRRKANIEKDLEKLAIGRAISALEKSDVVVIMIDSTLGVHDQDAKLVNLAVRRGKCLIVALNKWDLVKGTEREAAVMEELEMKMRFVPWAPVIETSAVTGRGVRQLFKEAVSIHKQWNTRVTTGMLNRFMEAAIAAKAPPFVGKRMLKFYYVTQVEVRPPVFIVHANRPKDIPESYRRYIINRLREEFGFRGAPIQVFFRSSHESKEKE